MNISVVIPTISGRLKYLKSCLATCLSQRYDDVEFIVSDNSEGEAEDYIKNLRDPRIRYIRPEKYLPMAAHWDYILPYCHGDLISIIGDDDGLMPETLSRVEQLTERYGIKPICHTLANYCWPDFPIIENRNKFWFFGKPSQASFVQDSNDFLISLCQAKMRYFNGPMIYHNFIPRQVIDRLSVNRSIFHRSSPDIYSAISIATQTDGFVVTEEVLTMSGQGARANGASVRNGGADGKRFITEMQSAEYFSRYRSLTVQLQTLDSILEASERYSKPELKDWIDYGEHFCGAANECLDMPVRSRAARQMALVVWEATKSGCLPYLLRDRGGKLLQKIWQTLRGQHGTNVQSAAESGFNTNVKYAVPPEVTDIYSATIHLHQLLKNGCKP